MNVAQTIDPYKVWNRFPKPWLPHQTVTFNKIRTEYMQLIHQMPGVSAKELRTRLSRTKRATFDMLNRLRQEGWIERVGQKYYVVQKPVVHVEEDDG